ncbi:MAG: hypothetical protein PHP51_01900 [Desulfotomaculaceae bacterium]|nr:hypothetical protein [Desulfotomaculaceae bacterium]MDD4766602.1 hypothetical protein [Desulfotomaculaceae bacterium]
MAYRSGDMALTFLCENIPVIGPRFKNREEAVKKARQYLDGISKTAGGQRVTPVIIEIKRQDDGRYSIILEGFQHSMGKLFNIDELFLKRFSKGLKRKMFILTCFVEKVDELECLVLTEGLGAVLYAPYTINKWRP